MTPIPSDLVVAVEQFRAALVRYSASGESNIWESFPRERCWPASKLLARFLAERGFGEAEVVMDARLADPEGGQPYTHAWLRLGEIVIDITASQFPGQPDLIVAAGNTPFHDSFTGATTFPYQAAPSLDGAYRAVLRYLTE